MILIIDNGSQYTHLIKRNCRDLGFEAQIIQNNSSMEEFEKLRPEKVILSGGPSSVYKGDNGLAEKIARSISEGKLNIPILGICFGHQLIAHLIGGKVEKGKNAEYGIAKLVVDKPEFILQGVPKNFNVWVSHFDEVVELPKDFIALAHSETCKYEAMAHTKKKIFGVQFHPEVWHTEHGEKILENFLRC